MTGVEGSVVEDETMQKRCDGWLWLLEFAMALLIVGCLTLIEGVNVSEREYRMESGIAYYPFCPPEIVCSGGPRPNKAATMEKHFAIWMVWDTRDQMGIETAFRTLIDIPLP